jgi:hypothetical protein
VLMGGGWGGAIPVVMQVISRYTPLLPTYL